MKGKILSLVISLLVLPVFFLYASSNDFDSLIESLAKSNDYSGQIKILRSVNDIDSFSEKEKDRLKRALLEMTINAENTVDPGLNAALLIEANRLFPDDPRLSVKLAKAYVELGQYKQALDAQFKVLTQSGGKSDDYELTTVFLCGVNYSTLGRSDINMEGWPAQCDVLLNHGLKRSFLPHTFTLGPQA